MSENNSKQSVNLAISTLTSLKVEKAIHLLDKRIGEIPDVQTWAEEVGVSRRWLCKYMKREYNKSPKIIIRDTRFKVIKECLRKDCEMTGYCAASEAGLSDENALYKFLSTHFDTSITQLRIEILKQKKV